MAKRRKTKRRKYRGTKAGSSSAGTGGAASPLLAQMSAYRAELLAQQSDIQNQVDKLDEAMSTLGGSAPASGRAPARITHARRGRPPGGVREGSLKSYIVKVMRKGQVMAVKDIAVAVRRGGYRSTSANFANQVSNALAQIPSVTKVSRGKFKL